MVGLFAYNPPLMLEALAQASKLGQVKVVAFDEDDATLAWNPERHRAWHCRSEPLYVWV